MGIVRFALRFPYTFYVLAALVVFLGVSAITVMPEDIFPEINIPVVTVVWQYTGLTTEEMEERVTTYSQYAISTSVSGVKNMEAQTLNGVSVIKIFFQPDVNLDLAISQIVAGTNYIRVLLPAGIQAPIVVSYNASSGSRLTFESRMGFPVGGRTCESARCALENRSPSRPPIFVGSRPWFKTATCRRSTSGGLRSCC